MGLISFLKNKFGKKKEPENQAKTEVKQEGQPQKEPVKEESSHEKYITGLDKSRIGFTERLNRLAKSNKTVNAEYFDELERILIEADVGVNLTLELIQ